MEVILKEDVIKLGHRGDVVKVADGYGRNYLLPGKLAIEATAANKAVIDQMKASAVRKSAKEKIEAEQLSTQLDAPAPTANSEPHRRHHPAARLQPDSEQQAKIKRICLPNVMYRETDASVSYVVTNYSAAATATASG